MAEVQVIMPKMGESVSEATITKWLKEEGEKISAEESLVEIATDKVDSEIPSPQEGTLLKKLFREGEVVQVGTAIAVIGTAAAAPTPPKESGLPRTAAAPSAPPAPPVQDPALHAAPAPVPAGTLETAPTHAVSATAAISGRFYSPLVRSIAKMEDIPLSRLDTIPGTGSNGRLTKKDILAYLASRGKMAAPVQPAEPAAANGSPAPAAPAKAFVIGQDDIIEMDRMRKLIADHMVLSKRTSPHVTSCVEADVTNIVLWRNRIKDAFEKKEGEKLTFTPVFIEAVVNAIRDFPLINASVDGDRIIVKKNINIGMAAALPSGNLIVPVIRNADRMNLYGLAKTVNDLARRARESKLLPDEIQGGTYTVTNVGTFGNVLGTPIINQPQVAVLATGVIRKKPVVIETPQGDTIGIRHMMFLSHSYDHRVVDGALGGSFVRRVADYLEQFDPGREL